MFGDAAGAVVLEKSEEPDSKERSKGLHTGEGVDDTNQSFTETRCLRKSAPREIISTMDVTLQKSSNHKLEVPVKEIAEEQNLMPQNTIQTPSYQNVSRTGKKLSLIHI